MMIKTGTVIQEQIVKVEFDEKGETTTETIIKAKKRNIIDSEDPEYDVQDRQLG
jgi:hypothetical protein